MAYSERDIEAVRSLANLAEVVSHYVRLVPAGPRRLKGLCPFHQEKTPSFHVDTDRQLYHCFGCGAGGDVFSFLMQQEKLSFTEAVEELAKRVGYTLTVTRERSAARDERERLYRAMEEALAAYHTNLEKSSAAAPARAYLASRGFTEATIDEFELGFAPDRPDLMTKHLRAKGFTESELVAAGLSRRTSRGLHDLFRGRVMFPIRDIRGRAVAFGGRVLGAGEPKYLNSPETPLFRKSTTLYNLHRARRAIVAEDRCLVVEGYTDVIALHQAGIEYAVATLGTALTADHVRTLLRFTQNVYLAFDADRAGRTAAERGLELIAAVGNARVSVVTLPEGSDPADFVAAHGRDAFEGALARAVRLEEFCMDAILARHDLADPKGKAAAAEALRPVFDAMRDPVVFEEYLRRAADLIGVSMEALRSKIRSESEYNTKFAKRGALPRPRPDAQRERERELLKTVLRYREAALALTRELLEEHELSDAPLRAIYAAALDVPAGGAAEGGDGEGALVTAVRAKGGEEAVRLLSELQIEPVRCVDPERVRDHVIELVYRIKDARLARAAEALKAELKRAEQAGDTARAADLLREIQLVAITRRGLFERLRESAGEQGA